MTDGMVVTRYAKKSGAWQTVSTSRARTAATEMQLEVRQDANTPPDVFVHDLSSGRSTRLLELNPQFRELSLGRVESFD